VLRILLAALHLLALGIGLGAVLWRAASLKQPLSVASVRGALQADTQWGLAALLWIVTGLWRYLGGIEKATSYYNHNHFFFAKMGLLVLILGLELSPMLTLIRWRAALGRGTSPEVVAYPPAAQRIRIISLIEAGLVIVMIVFAVSMARGSGSVS
jgi:putative membrane protein